MSPEQVELLNELIEAHFAVRDSIPSLIEDCEDTIKRINEALTED